MFELEKSFAVNIRKLRKNLNITQKQLAEKVGCSEKAISKWERAISVPDIEILFLLAKIFNINVESLFHNEDNVFFLGIDGGGTKTRLLLTDRDGIVIKDICVEGCNPIDLGIDKAKEILQEGIYEICKSVEISSVVVFAGIAGGVSGGMKPLLEEFFKSFNFKLAQNDTDNKNIIAAGLGENDGIALVLGTGICAYRKLCGQYTMVGGKGYLIDNGGSAYNIGRDGLNAYYCELDKIGEKTLITKEIQNISGNDPQKLLKEIYDGKKKTIASFATCVYKAAKKGDKTAIEIIERNMMEAAKLVKTLSNEFDTDKIPVVIAGGLTNDKLTVEYFKKALSDSEKYDVKVLDKAPVEGAVFLARKMYENKE